MKLLLLHLSDIHLSSPKDVILERYHKVIDAVKNLCPDAAGIVCVLSGDIADSGADSEYLLAIDLLDGIRTKLGECLPNRPITFVSVPGNHDLDLSTPSSARELILDEIKKSPDRLLDSSFSAIALAPLNNCFKLFDAIGTQQIAKDSFTEGHLFVQHGISIGAHTVVFNCLNTAALSRLHESPGQLIFPADLVQKPPENTALTVSVLHHPYNWLSPVEAKALRARLEEVSDIILTGHEHVIDRRSLANPDGANLYLEGGVLQDSNDTNSSEFYSLVIDLEIKKQRIIGFTWDSENDAYRPISGEDPAQFNIWEELLQSKLSRRRRFQPTIEFTQFLDDPDISLFHRKKQGVRLSDFYVYPDLKHIGSGKNGRIISASDVPTRLSQIPCVMLMGDDNSGKTALAKRFFHHLLESGDIPVWLDFLSAKINLTRVEEYIEEAVIRIYGREALLPYRQADQSKRILIIDNYHRLSIGGVKRRDLLAALRRCSFRIFVTASEMELALHELVEGQDAKETELPFEYYSILPFSVLRRNALVEKWLLIGGETDAAAVQFVQTLERITKIIQTLVGKNYVPAFPPYILAVLQATEAGTEVEVGASTHGYLYELFIKSSIAKYAATVDYHIICEYLSHVAYWMSSNGRREITESELQGLHGALQARFEVIPDFERQCINVVGTHMMVRRNDVFYFRHGYIFYYFLAFYLKDRIYDEKVKETIAYLVDNVHDEDSANILLFLSHLSKDRLILRLLLESAESKYKNKSPAKLADDVAFLNELHGDVKSIALPDKPFREARKDYLIELEAENKTEGELDSKTEQMTVSELIEPITRLNSAVKTIQILGQVLKNFPVNLEKDEKDQIITSVSSLGRRALTEILEITAKHRFDLLTYMAEIISKKRSDLTDGQIKERAATALVTLSEMAAFGMIFRIATAIGSDKLRTTYDRYFENQNEPIMRLVFAGLRLNHFEHFPESLVKEVSEETHNNPVAFCILRQLIVRHMHVFPVDYRLRQRMGALLKIDYQGIRAVKKERQLIE